MTKEQTTLTWAQRRYFVTTACDTGYTADTVKWAWEHLRDNLDDGKWERCWACDLDYGITEMENCDGYVDSPYTADAIEWMGQHIGDCAQYSDDEMNEYGERSNPFEDPTKFVCRLYIDLVARLIRRTGWFDEHLDDGRDVTEEEIKALRTELNMDEETDNDNDEETDNG